MKRINKIHLVLFLITFLGGIFRFWQLENYPVSLSIDEVAIGYNSYSILKTGRDEFGQFMPLAFRSVGDFKPPVLIYLMTPSIAFWGLNEIGVRFPIALIGTITPLVAFFLVKQLTKSTAVSIITAFSLAISPWHVFYSRVSFEAILALFFVLIGVWLFLKSIENGGSKFWLSAIFFVLSIYTYHAERVFTPFLILGLFVIYREKILKYRQESLKAFLIAIILLIPFALMSLGPEVQTRARVTFISQDENISYQLHQTGESLTFGQLSFDNNLILLGNFWIKRYLNYWDPSFLFFKGLKLTLPGLPDSGLFYFFEIPLFLLGLWFLLFKNFLKDKEHLRLIVFWILIGPIAASLTNNEQHSLRSLTWIPVLHLLVGIGGYMIYKKLEVIRSNFKFAVASFLGIIILGNFVYLYDLYFVHYPIQFSEHYDYGYEEAALFIKENGNNYDEIVVDNTFGSLGPYIVGTPHLYMMFYNQYSPEKLHKEREGYSENFENFNFRTIYWPEDRSKTNTLFIGSPWRLPLTDLNESQILKKIYFKNGNLGFLIVKAEK